MNEHLFDENILKTVVKQPQKDSYKGQNGKLLVIGGSPFFHGAGQLSFESLIETIIAFGSKTNDMAYFCSTKENLNYLKTKQEIFIGITREQVDYYLQSADVVLIGPGLMRESEPGREDTTNEPKITQELTAKVLDSEKKAVLDAGSLQVISKDTLAGKKNVIITPHRKEMSRLFEIEENKLMTSGKGSFAETKRVGQLVMGIAKEFDISILLKGPVDIAANKKDWFYIKGGNPGMTKGGTGDVLAGIVAALYSKIENPLLAAAAGSFITKKAGEKLWEKHLWVYNARDLVNELRDVLTPLLR